jgi:hypothetical protein
MTKTCVCGNTFKVSAYRLKQGRGKFCSNKCKYENMSRPSGLKYNIVKENSGWIQKGERLSPETEFKKGEIAYPENQWKLGQRISPATEFQKGNIPHNFKGGKVGYNALHSWVRRYKGKATCCEKCQSTSNVQWANKSWEYKRDLDDWLELCRKCHIEYDRQNWGAASRLFPEINRKKADNE